MSRPAHYEVFRGRGGWYFHLVAPNGEILTVSESYRTKWGANRGIKAAKRAFAEVPEKEVSSAT